MVPCYKSRRNFSVGGSSSCESRERWIVISLSSPLPSLSPLRPLPTRIPTVLSIAGILPSTLSHLPSPPTLIHGCDLYNSLSQSSLRSFLLSPVVGQTDSTRGFNRSFLPPFQLFLTRHLSMRKYDGVSGGIDRELLVPTYSHPLSHSRCCSKYEYLTLLFGNASSSPLFIPSRSLVVQLYLFPFSII